MSADRPARDEISYELGGIRASLDMITQTLSENRTADAQYRTGIRDNMAKQSEVINEVRIKLNTVTDDVAEMKPTVKSLEARALMSKGAANFAIILGKFAHVISAGLGGLIVLLVDRYIFGKHP